MKIIGFCGRMRSGKTELATICEKYGYERLYFAKPLKLLVAHLINGDIDKVNEYKTEKNNWQIIMSPIDCQYVSDETDIPLNVVTEKLLGKTFTTTRDMLQIIGTDLIREYNSNWHVNRIRKMLDESKNYVFDDVRFTNERKMIEELGGDNWFVVRPNITEVSHHISEETLKWQDFDKVIVNDKSLELFKTLWDVFMKTSYDVSLKARKEHIEKLNNNKEYQKEFLASDDEINSLSFLQISKDFFRYNNEYKNSIEIAEVKIYDEKKLLVCWNTKQRDCDIVSNSLEIEDLKIYL